MKSIALIAWMMIMGMIVEAQPKLKISGNINGLDSGIARLDYITDNQPKQITTVIHQGNFEFSVTLPEPEFIHIGFTIENGSREIAFFYGNEKVYITLDTAHWETPEITGSQTQREYEGYKQLTKSVDERSSSLNKTGSALYLSGKLDEKTKDSLFRVHDQLDLEKRIIIADFARAYPSSAVSAWAISVFYGYEPNLEELLPAYHLLSKQNQQGIYGKQIAEIISAAEKTAVGKKAPDFTLTDPYGKRVSLHSYRGKYVLVDFWASWCGPCRAENPNVVIAYKKYHSGKFDVLGVSLDDNRELWIKAIKKDNLKWTQGSELKAWDSKVVKDYGIKGIPFNMLLDKNGKIIARNLRGANLQNKLSELFQNGNPEYAGSN